MSKYSSVLCNGISPYVCGEQPRDKKYIKLNTNENPYPPSPSVKDVLVSFDEGRLKLYSDPNNVILRNAIASNYSLNMENVFVGNGSDEVLAMCFPAFCENFATFADITYSFYPVYCNLFGKTADIIPLEEDFSLDITKYFNRKSDMIIITNPNAPTGIAISNFQVEQVLKHNRDKIVIIDEAYSAFMGYSSVNLIKNYDNLLVVKTFSKAYSLAGARCGYALGNKSLIEDLNKIKNSFNSYTVNTFTEAVATVAIKDVEYLQKTTEVIIKTREFCIQALKKMNFEVLPSAANFVFAKHKTVKGETLYLKLKEAGILIRYFNKPKINDYLRITIGSDEEIKSLLFALGVIIANA